MFGVEVRDEYERIKSAPGTACAATGYRDVERTKSSFNAVVRSLANSICAPEEKQPNSDIRKEDV